MMSDPEFWPRLVLAVLAAWRVSHLLAHEDGPAGVVVRIRAGLGHGRLGGLMDCFNCISIWVSAPAACFVMRRPLEWFVAWLAVSGAAVLLEQMVRTPFVIQKLPKPTTGETENVMLRPKAHEPGDSTGDTH